MTEWRGEDWVSREIIRWAFCFSNGSWKHKFKCPDPDFLCLTCLCLLWHFSWMVKVVWTETGFLFGSPRESAFKDFNWWNINPQWLFRKWIYLFTTTPSHQQTCELFNSIKQIWCFHCQHLKFFFIILAFFFKVLPFCTLSATILRYKTQTVFI